VFISKSTTGFCIISFYLDDLNIIGHTTDIDEARNHLKMEFEMNDLGKTKICLGLKVGHLHKVFLYTSLLMSKRYWKSSIWIKTIRLELL
jgi:hypothetical protein